MDKRYAQLETKDTTGNADYLNGPCKIFNRRYSERARDTIFIKIELITNAEARLFLAHRKIRSDLRTRRTSKRTITFVFERQGFSAWRQNLFSAERESAYEERRLRFGIVGLKRRCVQRNFLRHNGDTSY